MYVPRLFAVSEDEARAWAGRWPFATLITSGSLGLYASHVPLAVDGDRLYGHVARASPHHRDFVGQGLAIFHGPHALVRSDWYGDPAAHVPTWNYAAVHARGTFAPAAAEEVLARLMGLFQADGAPPGDEVVARLTPAVVAFELRVERWEGKGKLSQNRDPDDRARVLERLTSVAPELAALMRR